MALLKKQNIIFITELFEQMQKAPDRMTRRQMLVEYASKDSLHEKMIRSFTELTWHPQIEFMLPEGAPAFTPSSAREAESPTNLFRVFRDIGRFLKNDVNLIQNPKKREDYFVSVLEALSTKEAGLLIAIKDKKVSQYYSTVTCDLFCEVFGGVGWLPKEVIDANPPKNEDAKKPLESSEV